MNGANASAAIYSVLETAKTNNLDFYGYMKCIIEQLPLVETEEQLAALLPWNLENKDLKAWDKYS